MTICTHPLSSQRNDSLASFCRFQDQLSRTVSCFLPVFLFALVGFEHCIANQFYVSLAIMYGLLSTWSTMLPLLTYPWFLHCIANQFYVSLAIMYGVLSTWSTMLPLLTYPWFEHCIANHIYVSLTHVRCPTGYSTTPTHPSLCTHTHLTSNPPTLSTLLPLLTHPCYQHLTTSTPPLTHSPTYFITTPLPWLYRYGADATVGEFIAQNLIHTTNPPTH